MLKDTTVSGWELLKDTIVAGWELLVDTIVSGWELLKDPIGRDHFLTFLEREYATGNKGSY